MESHTYKDVTKTYTQDSFKGKIITSSQSFNLIQVKQKRRGNNPLIQSIKDEFYINFSRKMYKISEMMTRA